MKWDSHGILFLASFFFFLTSVLAMLLFVFLDHMWSKLRFDQPANGSLLTAGGTETEILVSVSSIF